jgi:hypothetical protein
VKTATEVGMPWPEVNPEAVMWNLEPFPAFFGVRVTLTVPAATAVPTNANKATAARRRDFLVDFMGAAVCSIECARDSRYVFGVPRSWIWMLVIALLFTLAGMIIAITKLV